MSYGRETEIVTGNFPKFRGSHIKTSVTKGNKRRAQWQEIFLRIMTCSDKKNKKVCSCHLGKHANFSVLVKSIAAIKLASLYKLPPIFFCCN